MILVTNSKDPRIAEFMSVRDHVLHSQNLIIAETEKCYLQFISSGRKVYKVLATEEFINRHKLEGDNIFMANKEILEGVSGFKVNYDVLFLADKPKDHDLSKLDDKIILLNGLTSPENVGSIVRSAAAFEINSIITDEKTCSPYLRRCIRVSTGNAFAMKTHHSINVRGDLNKLKTLGYTILSTANVTGAVNIANYSFPQKCVVIIGSEGHGVDHDILVQSDVIVKIPINSQVAHLNAANAASIFLFKMSDLIK
jgi:tRNA G18 (ribose-2'-O)-methylase SpoU